MSKLKFNTKMILVILAGSGMALLMSCSKWGLISSLLGQDKNGGNPHLINVQVPAGPNSWAMNLSLASGVTLQGIRGWKNPAQEYETYVLVTKPGKIEVKINASETSGTAVMNVSILGKSRNIAIHGDSSRDYNLGSYQVDSAQYLHIHLKAVSSTSGVYPDINSYTLSTIDTTQQFKFITLTQSQPMLWARRGPAQHIYFPIPANGAATSLYSELTVPAGSDQPGSYFMADGFSGGYFGIQNSGGNVKSVLFSIWTAKHYANWSDVPDSEQTVTLRMGPGMTSGHFEDGGTGNHIGGKYNWVDGTTYRFLVNEDVNQVANYAVFTAWIAPKNGPWALVGSIKKPLYTKYFSGFYSFIENFIPNTGNLQREGFYGNEWYRDTSNQWIAENTAGIDGIGNTQKNRYDYDHGVKNGQFFLSGFGFIYSGLPPTQKYTRATTSAPDIDFNSLP